MVHSVDYGMQIRCGVFLNTGEQGFACPVVCFLSVGCSRNGPEPQPREATLILCLGISTNLASGCPKSRAYCVYSSQPQNHLSCICISDTRRWGPVEALMNKFKARSRTCISASQECFRPQNQSAANMRCKQDREPMTSNSSKISRVYNSLTGKDLKRAIRCFTVIIARRVESFPIAYPG
jgi:hypothetical protein